ncbi:MAG: ABC transporter permease [Chitinophagaceae bacterium]|jgi:putative ABC transport system permease protein|nr:ABC transporter permease [Chitinophagaceae bacterium]
MRKTLTVIWNSLLMALDELRVNKLRTFLSLFGVTIGIFCIIGVLATVQSLESSIKNDLSDLGSSTIYIQTWPWGGGDEKEFPWWKYMKRPQPKYEELKPIQERSQYARAAAFLLFNRSNVEFKESMLTNVVWYGATEDFNQIQEVKIEYGRYLSASEFASGAPVLVMGYENAVKLFDKAEYALDKVVEISGRLVTVVGVMKKQGQSMVGGWDFDNIIIVPFNFCRQVVDQRSAERFLLVGGKPGVPLEAFKDELRGIMRSVRKLKPTEDDNFALNDVTSSTKSLEGFFANVNIGGFVIGGFSLIVGLFGIANIMFVTVKERTSQIGLKKAIGAKKSTILTEFLMESSFLCIIGGLIGLLLVFLITLGLSAALPFKVGLSPGIIALGLGISISVGLLAGIIPAWTAAKLDPVVAIRS